MSHRKPLTESKTQPVEKKLDDLLASFHKKYPEGSLQFLEKIAIEDLWRFFIDGDDQIAGCDWTSYNENEPGYLYGMYSGFSFVVNALQNSTTLDTHVIKNLHQLALNPVAGTNYDSLTLSQEQKSDKFEFNNFDNVGFSLTENSTTLKGLFEILQKINNGNPFLVIKEKSAILYSLEETKDKNWNEKKVHKDTREIFGRDLFMCPSVKVKSKEEGQKIYNDYIDQLIQNYHQTIKNAKTNREKLSAIIFLVRELDQLHPYIDGNIRTYCMLLQNFLLMQNHFPPAILFDPNRFDGFALEELIAEVVDGMQASIYLAEHRTAFKNAPTNENLPAAKDDSSREILELAVRAFIKTTKNIGVKRNSTDTETRTKEQTTEAASEQKYISDDGVKRRRI